MNHKNHKNHSSDNIPQLRFPEFDGEWEKKKLGEVRIQIVDGDRGINYPNGSDFSNDGYCLFMNAKNVTKNGFSFIEKSFITKEKDELLRKGKLEKFDIVLTTRGSVGHISYYDLSVPFEHLRINSGMVLIRTNQEIINSDYLYKYFNSNQIQREIDTVAFGSAQPQLTVGEISKFNLSFPTLPEQTKIANFLTAVDEKLQALKKKKSLLEQYKKGVMQKLFSQELRFKDENSKEFAEWKAKKLGEVLSSISTKKHQVKSKEINIIGKHKVINQGQELIAGYSDKTDNIFNNYPIIVFGDHTTILKFIDFEFIVGADGTKILKNKNKDDNIKFIFYNMCFNNVPQEGYKRHFSMLSDVFLQIPCIEEQIKIANFLSAIDEKINHNNMQIQKMELWEKGLLQKMFV